MATSALAGVSIRLSGERRLALADRLVDLCGAALLLRHPESHKLVRISADRFWAAKTDRLLLAGIATLTRFVRDHADAGIVLPDSHRCYVAPPADVEILRPWVPRGGA